MTGTIRLTTAQALVRWMVAQRSELLDGSEVPLFPGVFAIFGHGNVLGLGTALHEAGEQLPTWRGQNEQGMALAAVGFARATDRRQVMPVTTSIAAGMSREPKYPASCGSKVSPSQCSTTGAPARDSTSRYTRA